MVHKDIFTTLFNNHIPLNLPSGLSVRVSRKSSKSKSLYLNTNSIRIWRRDKSLNAPFDRWSRIKSSKNAINDSHKRGHKVPVYSDKSQGTWIHYDLWDNYAEWLERYFEETGLRESFRGIEAAYEGWVDWEDLYFCAPIMFNEGDYSRHILRINEALDIGDSDSVCINLTDISNVYGKDLRTWKKTKAYKDFIEQNPSSMISGNSSLDEFGKRCTYANATAAKEYLEYVRKNGTDSLYVTIRNFIERWERANGEDDDLTVWAEVESDSEEEESEGDEESEVKGSEGDEESESSDKKEMDLVSTVSQSFGGVTIIVREKDGFVNATQMCKDSGKRFGHWIETNMAHEIMHELSVNIGIPMFKLVEVKQGRNGGSWIHPDLAIQLAQWCMPNFALRVSKWIRELAITGSVKLSNPPKTDSHLSKLAHFPHINISPYTNTDVVYILNFDPVEKFTHINSPRKYYKFGFTQNIEDRLSQHERDKAFSNVVITDIFKCDSGNETSQLEKHIKRFVKNSNLSIAYLNKKECFMATDTEYTLISNDAKQWVEDRQPKRIENGGSVSKLEIIRQMYENGKLTFEQFEKLFLQL